LFRRAFRIAPLLKDRAFEAEREWRLVWRSTAQNVGALQVRAHGALLKPYVEIGHWTDNLPALTTVYVGPMRDQDEGIFGVVCLGQSTGNRIQHVVRSLIPFRRRESD
jgi:hypothetical protein